MQLSATALFTAVVATSASVTTANPVAGPVPPPSQKFQGAMRSFTPGLGSCGFTNSSNQNVVGLSAAIMQNPPNPNVNPKCGHKIIIKYKGTTAKGELVDTCTSCATDDINVSDKIFKKFAPLSQGRVNGVKWHFA